MSRITLEEFVEENEVLEASQPITIDDESSADLIAEQAEAGIQHALESLEDYSIAMEKFDGILTAISTIKSKNTISTENFAAFKSDISVAVEAMGGTPSIWFPALESVSDYKIAIESAEDQAQNIAQRFSRVIGKIFASLKDNMIYMVQFCDFQQQRLDEVRKLVEATGNDKHTLELPRTMYLRYGDGKDVTTAKEYLEKLKESAKVINIMTKEVGQFTKSDCFSTLRNFYMMFGSDTFIRNYTQYADALGAISKGVPTKEISSGNGVKIIRSDYLLGEYRITLSIPKNGVKDAEDLTNDNMKYALNRMGMRITHNFDNITGKVVLKDMDKKTMLAVIDEIQSIIKGYKIFYTFTAKLSHLGSISVLGGMFNLITDLTPLGTAKKVIIIGLMVFTANYRLILKGSGMILDTAATTLNIAKGTTKNALSMAYKFSRTAGYN